jgi:hypothetical protein
MSKSFYNTINAEGQMLMSFDEQAAKQDDIILDLFRKNAHRDITPFEMESCLRLNGKRYPITSIRRSITNLTKEGKLVKTEVMRPGEYGKPNYAWRYNNGNAVK